MNESDFRDWMRNQLRSFDLRIQRLEARPVGEAAVLAVDGRMTGEIATLAEGLHKRVMEKKIAGLAIAFVTVDGTALSGFAAAAGTYFQLAGATNFVGLEVLEAFRQAEAAAIAEKEQAA
jgi:hypothetical protein